MKKWNYLVASVLMLGAIAVTSCIDNDEPAGINDLRGAKAEYIRAKTQWELASAEVEKVKVEREKVALEQDKVALELAKLNVERQQALTAWAKDSLTAKGDSLKAAQEVVMKNIAKEMADAEAEYQKALVDLQIASLTYKDDAFQTKINEYTGALATARQELTREVNDLYGKQTALIDFLTDTAVFVKRQKMSIEEKKGALTIQEQILKDMEGFAATPWTEWNTKLADVTKEIAEIDKNVVDQMGAINQQKSDIQPVEANIAREEAKKQEPNQTFTIQQVDEALQDGFGTVVGMVDSRNKFNGAVNNVDAAFIEENNQYQMVADWTVSNFGLENMEKDFSFLLNQVKYYYRSQLADAFLRCFEDGTYNTDYDPTDAQLARVKGELKRLEIDRDADYAAYQSDSTEWADAYTAYMKALKDYKTFLTQHTYNAIKEKVVAYTILADKTDAELTKIQTELKAYYAVRNVLDGSEPTYPNADGKNVKISTLFKADGITNDNFNNWIVNTPINIILGDAEIVKIVAVERVPDKDREGAAQRIIRASYATFGGSNRLNDIVEPKYVDDKLVLPEDVDVLSGGSYATYMNSYKSVKIFLDIEKWMALAAELDAIEQGFKDQLQAIDDTIATLELSIADKKDAIWKAEFEVFLLDNTQRFEMDNNPYINNSSLAEGQKQALETLQRTIKAAIDNEGVITYVVYNADTHAYETNDGTIENLIAEQKEVILDAEQAVADAESTLQKFMDMGLMNDEYQKTLEQEIADQQLTVDEYQAAVDRLNATLKEFLAAYGD